MASSEFRLRFVGDIDARVRSESRAFARWIRQRYTFPNPLELRLLGQDVIIDDNGDDATSQWWQCERGREGVVIELAIGSLAGEAGPDGPVNSPELLSSLGVALKCYYQLISNAPYRMDYAESWSDKLLDAYVHGTTPPPPRSGLNLW